MENMYSIEQLAAIAIEHAKEISALRESSKSAHKRIDENDRLTEGIHELAQNVAAMSMEIKMLAERVDKSVEQMEQGLQSQGRRIGDVEKAVAAAEHIEQTLKKHENRIAEIEKEPATKWKNLVWLVIAGIATAIVGAVIGKFV